MNIQSFISKVNIYHILLLAFIIRIAAFIALPNLYFPDAQAYVNAGKEFVLDWQMEEHLAMPLYPLLTYILQDTFYIKLSNIVFSVIVVFVVYHLSLEIFKNKQYAVITAIMTALYPFFIFYSITGLTETLFMLLLLLSFLLLYKRYFLLASIVIVLSILQRPVIDLLAPLLIFVFAFVVHRLSFKHSVFKVLQYLLVYVIFMSPWWIHQQKKYDSFVRLSLGDGIVWYAGNNPLNKTGGGIVVENGIGDVDFSQFSHIKDPIERNLALKQAAFEFIKNNPDRFVELAGLKFIRFWRLWPYAPEYSSFKYIFLSLISYGVVVVLFIVFLLKYLKQYFRSVLPILLVIAYLTAIHMILIASIRYRLPIEPFLVILSGLVFGEILDKLKITRSHIELK